MMNLRRFGAPRAVPCRDMSGASARLLISPDGDGVVLAASVGGPLRLTAAQLRRLYAALAHEQLR